MSVDAVKRRFTSIFSSQIYDLPLLPYEKAASARMSIAMEKDGKENPMKSIYSHFNNEHGSVIVVAMIILTLLTILGISSTSTSILEVQIATNSQNHQLDFYAAESGWKEAAMWLENHGGVPVCSNGFGTAVKNFGTDTYTYEEADKAPDDGVDNDGNGIIDDELNLVEISTLTPDSIADGDQIDNNNDGTIDEAGETAFDSLYGLHYYYNILNRPEATAREIGSSFKYQRLHYLATSVARRDQLDHVTAEIQVDLSKVFRVGYN
jgi:hypothetical protein